MASGKRSCDADHSGIEIDAGDAPLRSYSLGRDPCHHTGPAGKIKHTFTSSEMSGVDERWRPGTQDMPRDDALV
jgi:hypothetical protein